MSETNPQDGEPQATPYQQLGGETHVRALVDRFYALLEHEPRYAVVRRLYPPDLTRGSETNSFREQKLTTGPNETEPKTRAG